MTPTIKNIPVSIVLTFEALLRFGLLATLFQAEVIASGLLAKTPTTDAYYYANFTVALIFAGLIRFSGPNCTVADIQELCLYDALVQLIGLFLFKLGSPDTSAMVQSASTMVLLAKAVRLLWPITVLPNEQVAGWPTFGILGLLRGAKWERTPNPKWYQRPMVIYACLLATLPIGHALYTFTEATKLTPLTYTMFAISLFGLQPLIRWLKQLEQDRRNAIAQEHAAQAQIIIMEKARAAHFEAQAAELSAAYAAQATTLAQVRQHNARILHANHDIMQPMFWLSSAVQKAANTSTEAAVTEILGIALRGAHEVTDMISDVFHQVTLENSGQTVLPQVLQVSQLKQYFWDRFYDLAQAHQVQLAMGNEAFAVLVHEPRLRRVIANLLNNAILYAGPGSSVSLRFARRYGACHIFVRNSGLGIADANTPDRAANTRRLLEQVAIAHSPENLQDPTKPLIGHGIGLHSTAQLCEELASHLLLRSRPGHGAVFYLRIPLA